MEIPPFTAVRTLIGSPYMQPRPQASTNYDNNARQLINIADIYGLHQLISEPTRITDKSSTLIDLIYTNCPERVVCSGVAHISISDQSCLCVS